MCSTACCSRMPSFACYVTSEWMSYRICTLPLTRWEARMSRACMPACLPHSLTQSSLTQLLQYIHICTSHQLCVVRLPFSCSMTCCICQAALNMTLAILGGSIAFKWWPAFQTALFPARRRQRWCDLRVLTIQPPCIFLLGCLALFFHRCVLLRTVVQTK